LNTALALLSDPQNLKEQTSALVAEAASYKIVGKASYEIAVSCLHRVKAWSAKLTEIKKSISDPQWKAFKATGAVFNPMIAEAAKAETILKDAILAFHAAQGATSAAKVAEVISQVEAGEIAPQEAELALSEASLEKAQKTVVVDDGAGAATIVKRRVVVVEEEGLVPDEYWVLDMPRLNKAALSGTKIPGVKVVTQDTVSSR
jgi:hypothetical protein